MNGSMLSIYATKIKRFYDKGYSQEEVKTSLVKEKDYYEVALFESNERKSMIENIKTLEELYNEDTLGFNGEFKTFEEFKANIMDDLATLKKGCLEEEEYHLCDYYNNPKDVMCTRWEVENRIYAIEHCLANL